MSLQRIFCVKKPNVNRKISTGNSENEFDSLHLQKMNGSSVKRTLFEDLTVPKKQKVFHNLFQENIQKYNKEASPVKSEIKLHVQNPNSLQSIKQSLHTSQLSRLVGRQKEINEISTFLYTHICGKKPGSLYISGAPGTGKTSCLMNILSKMEIKFHLVFINCMTIKNPQSIFKTIATKLGLSENKITPKHIEKCLVTSEIMTVFILDEIDHLDIKGQEVLYSLFEWPQLSNSTAILIGIANALDLTDRVLPRLQAFGYEPKLLNFQPYTQEQIMAILKDRISNIQNSGVIIKPSAIQLCARKIAACTGDIRKALDVCRRAIEVVEKQARQQRVLKVSSDDRCNPGSPMKSSTVTVDITHISAILNEIYGSRIQTSSLSTNQKTVTLPLQQVLLMCALILMKKCCKSQDFYVGKIYEVYRKICRKRQIAEVGESEFHSLCQLVELRGFIELKRNKVARLTKVSLKIDEREAEFVLQDKTLLSAVLADTSVILNK